MVVNVAKAISPMLQLTPMWNISMMVMLTSSTISLNLIGRKRKGVGLIRRKFILLLMRFKDFQLLKSASLISFKLCKNKRVKISRLFCKETNKIKSKISFTFMRVLRKSLEVHKLTYIFLSTNLVKMGPMLAVLSKEWSNILYLPSLPKLYG